MTRRTVATLAALGCLVLPTACSDDEPADAGSASSSADASAATPTADAGAERPAEPMAVVGHATRPQLRLGQRTARRIVAGSVDRWRGLRVVTDLPPARALRAVQRDPSTIAVVPVSSVGPTVVAARVGGVDPVRDAPGAQSVTVVGDLMLVRGVPDPWRALAPMARRLRSADLTVGNLESTLSLDGAPTQGGDSFGATPALLRPLRRAGFDALSLANNHTGDHGEAALLATVRALAASPVAGFGAGPDLARAGRPAVLEVDGTAYAFVGFNAIGETPRALPRSPGALSVRMPIRTGPLQEADLAHVERLVRRAGRTADAVVVLPHWGDQYVHAPLPIQRLVARRLVRAGADLVVGGHPHVVQGMDAVRGVPVLHSLGNFVFDMDFSVPTMQGVVLETTWWDGELKALRLVPYRMDAGSFAPRVVGGAEAADILGDLRSTSTGPYAG